MDNLIIGAGISGLALANLFHEKGIDFDIVEKESQAGGLIACENINGVLYHRVGGHVFNSKIDKVLDWFWSKFDRNEEFVKVERNAKTLIGKDYINYPIENHIHQLPEDLGTQIFKELLEGPTDGQPPAKTFKRFLGDTFGETLCDMYFYPYNEKIWACDLEEVSLDWLEGKLPQPDTLSIIKYNVFRSKETQMVHSTFYYPKKNGSQFIVDRLSAPVNIVHDSPIERIDIKSDELLVDGKAYKRVIYTGDIRKLRSVISNPDDELSQALVAASELHSHGTSNLLCECDPTDIS